jgi:hypothetical protein
MTQPIVIPVLVSKQAGGGDPGGVASIGRNAREAVHEQVESIAVDEAALDRIIDSAVAFLRRAAAAASKVPKVQLDTMAVQLGVTASGAIGLLGTGIEVEAEASFELTFKIVND